MQSPGFSTPHKTLLATTSIVASVAAPSSAQKPVSSSTSSRTSNTKPVIKPKSQVPIQNIVPDILITPTSQTPTPSLAARVIQPYTYAPLPFESIDTLTRGATVNILCMPKGGSMRPTSGSGVIIDPRGVILTNAHVAQYVLLSQSSHIDLSCTIRTGSPSTTKWIAEVLFIPTSWVEIHASEINSDRPTGTGEHDYALLRIKSDLDGSVSITEFPSLSVDTRENIAFQNDNVLVAGYPAEFVGGLAAQSGLYAATSIATVRQLLTFESGTVDLFSVGGIIEAQGGSSGGPAVNPWKRVVGIVTTTSEGATTADRDLHINTLAYINRDLQAETGSTLQEFLADDIKSKALQFNTTVAPTLLEIYFKILTH